MEGEGGLVVVLGKKTTHTPTEKGQNNMYGQVQE